MGGFRVSGASRSVGCTYHGGGFRSGTAVGRAGGEDGLEDGRRRVL